MPTMLLAGQDKISSLFIPKGKMFSVSVYYKLKFKNIESEVSVVTQ